jgi:glutamate racemase
VIAPIGVFDSGVGGLSVLRALRAELPHEDFVYYADSAHAPYGERGDGHVIERTRRIVETLVDGGAKAVVVACNTATAAAIHLMRAEFPGLLLVGVEPALKPAAACSQTRRIGVLGTRGTLGSAKMRMLHDTLRTQADFVLQPCPGLASAIEADDRDEVGALCARYLGGIGPFGTAPGQIDTLVLGCTHYPFALDAMLPHLGPGVQVLETGVPVARQTHRLLQAAGCLRADSAGAGNLTLMASGSLPQLEAAAARWL